MKLLVRLVSKRLELLREIIPDLRRLAIMGNVGNPGIVLELDEVEALRLPSPPGDLQTSRSSC